MPSRRRLAIVAALLVAFGYLGMLQVRAADREAPLVVLWTSGVVETTVRHPRTGLAGWGVKADVDALIARVEGARGWRTTRRMRSDPTALDVRIEDVRGHRVAFAEVPVERLAELPAALLAALGTAGPVELTIVGSSAAPSAVLAAVAGPVAVLPGAYGAGVPDGGEAEGTERLVAPWIDSRTRVGALHVRFEGAIALRGTAVDLPLREAPAGTRDALGMGSPALHHDTVRFGRSGLGEALLARVLATTGADIALLNYLALRGGLEGPIDLLKLEKALPFHNEVVLQTFDTPRVARILAQGAPTNSTQHLLVGMREHFDAPLPERAWRVATIDYLANGGRGGWGVFNEGRDRLRTRISLDTLAIGLLTREVP